MTYVAIYLRIHTSRCYLGTSAALPTSLTPHPLPSFVPLSFLVGLPRFDGQGWWLGQATWARASLRVVVSNSSGVR
jgi:hypothetical protein